MRVAHERTIASKSTIPQNIIPVLCIMYYVYINAYVLTLVVYECSKSAFTLYCSKMCTAHRYNIILGLGKSICVIAKDCFGLCDFLH